MKDETLSNICINCGIDTEKENIGMCYNCMRCNNCLKNKCKEFKPTQTKEELK